jgi:hypothetical protein
MLISIPLKNLQKVSKKVINEKVTEIWTFITVFKSFRLLIFCVKKVLGFILSLLANFKAKRERNGSKTKKVFYNLVLEFHFASIFGLGDLIYKKVNFSNLRYSVYSNSSSTKTYTSILFTPCTLSKGISPPSPPPPSLTSRPC